jgi:hypothetical protein
MSIQSEGYCHQIQDSDVANAIGIVLGGRPQMEQELTLRNCAAKF